MEFIHGTSLLRYAEAHQLSTRQRLELMAKVCEAVHHAHQRGIIDHDLKPGNILVDETGQRRFARRRGDDRRHSALMAGVAVNFAVLIASIIVTSSEAANGAGGLAAEGLGRGRPARSPEGA
ncbi:hypothetical protein SBA3_1760006 [Candidatus Sulfopaludibacter sp. SbA3]|nr:hypothetical protein SBA3_1760006 [Candidatus Sulfopaludibacter sp. SbA3]